MRTRLRRGGTRPRETPPLARRVTLPLVLALVAAAAATAGAQASEVAQPAATTSVVDSVALFGEVRTRGEVERPGSGVAADAFTLLRTRVGTRARLGATTRLLVEVQDSRVFGEERSTVADGTADALDLHQGWLELGGTWRGAGVSARAGRQEIALGNERLIGAVGWSNTGRAFDGLRALASSGSGANAWQATLLGATLEERGRRYGAAAAAAPGSSDQSLVALFTTRGAAELLVARDAGTRARAFYDVRRTTAYARWHPSLRGGLRADVEAAWQTGAQTLTSATAQAVAQDISAWFAGVRLQRAASAGLPLALSVGADVLSGDDDPTDAGYAAFNTLYATNHKWYGTMDLFLDPAAATRDRGLVDATAGAALTLSSRATLRADAHGFWLAQSGSAAGLGDERALGWELDLTLPLKVSPAGGVELGWSLFRPGAAGQALALGGEGHLRQCAYAQLRAGF